LSTKTSVHFIGDMLTMVLFLLNRRRMNFDSVL